MESDSGCFLGGVAPKKKKDSKIKCEVVGILFLSTIHQSVWQKKQQLAGRFPQQWLSKTF